MKISSKKLIGLPVETQSGQKLGKVESFNIDVESQSILEYLIKSSNLVTGLVRGNLIISRGQVIEITNKKMVVDDNVAYDKKVELKKTLKVKEKMAQGVVMREVGN